VTLLLLVACAPEGSSPLDSGDAPVADTAPDTLPGEDDAVGFGCAPQAAEASGVERDTLTTRFACTGAATAESWEWVSGPDAATFDAATGTVTWETDLASAGEWTVVVHAIADGAREEGEVTLWVADAWDARGNDPVDPLTYTMEFGLPVFHLDGAGALDDAGMRPVDVTYKGHAFVGAEGQLRGAASSYYPKKSYRVDFAPDDEFADEAEGFPKRRSLVLTSTFDDNSYFRQKLCFDIWNLIAPARPIETRFAVVYLDGEYAGLYLLGDHVDGEWFEDQGYPEDGNLYKSVDHAANFYSTYGGAKSSWHQGYEKKEGLPEDDFSDLDALVEFVATSPDGGFEAEIAGRIDVEDVYDWWALVVYTEADDSGGKNVYLYSDPASPFFRVEPWDFNHSLGQTWQTEREPPYYDYDFTGANNLFLRLLASPTHGGPMRERFAEARAGALSAPAIQALIDDYIDRIDASARRDEDKWQREYRTYGGWSWRDDWTTYEEEVEYVRWWVDERVAFVDDWL